MDSGNWNQPRRRGPDKTGRIITPKQMSKDMGKAFHNAYCEHNMEVKVSAHSQAPTCQRCSKCGYTEWF